MQAYMYFTFDPRWTHLILLENVLPIPLYFNFNVWYSNQNLTTLLCIPRDEKCEGIKNIPLNFYQIRALAALMIQNIFCAMRKPIIVVHVYCLLPFTQLLKVSWKTKIRIYFFFWCNNIETEYVIYFDQRKFLYILKSGKRNMVEYLRIILNYRVYFKFPYIIGLSRFHVRSKLKGN